MLPPPPRPPQAPGRRQCPGPGLCCPQGGPHPCVLASGGSGEPPGGGAAEAKELWRLAFDDQLTVHVTGRGDFRLYVAGAAGPLLLCLHGGAYTGLTWGLLAERLKHRCRLAALDLRGHGLTRTPDDADLSLATLTQDVVGVWRQAYGGEAPPTVLVGHSMGGAVAVHAALSGGIAPLAGLVVVDVVEGTALASLPHMAALLQRRPPGFPSPQAAVEWALASGMSRSERAAALSIPSQLRPVQEEGGQVSWRWRTQLLATQRFWEGWYRGLSEAFLAARCPKVLIMANQDRLDRPLTIGQMQGRFQAVLLPQAGHAVHEDLPEKTAEVLSSFLTRFRIGDGGAASCAPAGAGVVLPQVMGPLC